MKKIIMVLLVGLVTGALVFLGCGSISEPIYSETNQLDSGPGGRLQTGEISGMITLTDVLSPVPRVSIWGKSDDIFFKWWIRDSDIKLNSGNYTNLSCSIPIYEDDSFFLSNCNFSLFVYPTGSNNMFWVQIPTTSYIGSANASGINLGTVSIKSITLSGTINIAHNGQPVKVGIEAINTDGQFIGLTYLDSPAVNAPWSIMVSAINSDVTFSVYSFSGPSSGPIGVIDLGDEWDFFRVGLSPVSVNNQDKSGIVLNLGNIID